MNNASLFTADRMTHLKIVVLSLVCATLIAGISVASRLTDTDVTGPLGRLEATGPVFKAGKPITASVDDHTVVR